MSMPSVSSAPAHIDPRIRARRLEVQRNIGLRRLQRVIDVGLVVLVAAGFALALRSPLLDVDAIVVEGNGHTSADAILERAGIDRGDALMDLDLHAAGNRVAALPWVGAVELQRGLDGRVAVQVREREPVAVAGEGEAAVLVDADGRVLGPLTDAPDLGASLVRIVDVGELPAPGAFLASDAGDALRIAAELVAAASGNALQLSFADGLTIVLDSGAEVRLGGTDLLDAKIRSLGTVLEQVDLTCAAVIDLRSPGSPVLTREEGCS